MIMKNTFEPEASRKTNSKRWLAWSAGLVLLGLSVWAACGCLAFQRTHYTHSAHSCCNWYQRCRLEVRQFVSVMNYLLTPEEDVGVISVFVDPRPAVLPSLGRLTPNSETGTDNVSVASDAADRP